MITESTVAAGCNRLSSFLGVAMSFIHFLRKLGSRDTGVARAVLRLAQKVAASAEALTGL